jgi:hypothetical protein
MITKIFTGTCVVVLAVLLLASAPVATASVQSERDFYDCVKSATVLPPADELKTCMVQKGHSEAETEDVIKSLPDQELYAPYTGYESRGGNGGQSGSTGDSSS